MKIIDEALPPAAEEGLAAVADELGPVEFVIDINDHAAPTQMIAGGAVGVALGIYVMGAALFDTGRAAQMIPGALIALIATLVLVSGVQLRQRGHEYWAVGATGVARLLEKDGAPVVFPYAHAAVTVTELGQRNYGTKSRSGVALALEVAGGRSGAVVKRPSEIALARDIAARFAACPPWELTEVEKDVLTPPPGVTYTGAPDGSDSPETPGGASGQAWQQPPRR